MTRPQRQHGALVAAALLVVATSTGCPEEGDPVTYVEAWNVVGPGELCLEDTLCPFGGREIFELRRDRLAQFSDLLRMNIDPTTVFTPLRCECITAPEVRAVPDSSCSGVGLRVEQATSSTAGEWSLLDSLCLPAPEFNVRSVPVGETCPLGGIAVETRLDGAEGPMSETVTCFAAQQIQVTPLSPGARCPSGGVSVSQWLDADGDGGLSGAESAQTFDVCSGGLSADAPFPLAGRLYRRTFVGAVDVQGGAEVMPLDGEDPRSMTAPGLSLGHAVDLRYSDTVAMEGPGTCVLELRVNGGACATGDPIVATLEHDGEDVRVEQVTLEGRCAAGGFSGTFGRDPVVALYARADAGCTLGAGPLATLEAQNVAVGGR